MEENGMGTDETVTAKEAAEILGVSTSRIYQMYRDDLLRGIGRLKQDLRFSLEEVCALAEARQTGGRLGVQKMGVKLTALTSRVGALERRLQGIERMIGLRTRYIGHDDVEVRALWLRAQDAVDKERLDPAEIQEWIEIFFGIHEEFLYLIEHHAKNANPCDVFFSLSQKLYDDGVEQGLVQDAAIRSELDAARNSMRQAIWSYLHRRRGSTAAKKAMPDVEQDPFERLLKNHVHLRR